MVAGSQRDEALAACAAKPGSAEDYPFGDEVAVFKVAGRMFALVSLGPAPGSISLKCDPGLAGDLRGRYAVITPGYHLNKRHWNTVTLDGSVPEHEVLELVDHSYDLVLAGLSTATRNKLVSGSARYWRRPSSTAGARQVLALARASRRAGRAEYRIRQATRLSSCARDCSHDAASAPSARSGCYWCLTYQRSTVSVWPFQDKVNCQQPGAGTSISEG